MTFAHAFLKSAAIPALFAAGLLASSQTVNAAFLPEVETENPSVAISGPAPAAAPIEIASVASLPGLAARASAWQLRDVEEKQPALSDIALRHTDKTFFSHNPLSMKRVPPSVEEDNDSMTSTALAWEKENQPFDQVVAVVDLSDQRMRVYVEGVLKHEWKVSSGRRGYGTPTGEWRPYRMHTLWHSRKYNMAPMPHSVFFHGGYAVHATGATGRLGRPASHGCIRLHPRNAKKFFRLVLAHKKAGTIVRIVR